METRSTPSKAAEHYAKAHAEQYGQRDLHAALHSYARVIAMNPGTPEEGYSRTQIQGIVTRVVPAELLRAAQTALALEHLQSAGGAAAMGEPS